MFVSFGNFSYYNFLGATLLSFLNVATEAEFETS